MSSEKESKPKKAPAKKAATKTGEAAEKKVKAAPKPKVAAAAVATKAVPASKAKTAAKVAVAAGVPEVAAQVAKLHPTHQQIAELAYSYYIERGWAQGHDKQDWFRAELVLRGR